MVAENAERAVEEPVAMRAQCICDTRKMIAAMGEQCKEGYDEALLFGHVHAAQMRLRVGRVRHVWRPHQYVSCEARLARRLQDGDFVLRAVVGETEITYTKTDPHLLPHNAEFHVSTVMQWSAKLLGDCQGHEGRGRVARARETPAHE